MSSEPERNYHRFIYLSTRVIQAGSDMIEAIGELNGIRYASEDRAFKDYHMNDLRKAIAKAHAALANYDACVSADINTLTSSEFDAAAKDGKAA
jgi:hypothetical protein